MNEIRIRAVIRWTGAGMSFTPLSVGNSSQKLKFYIIWIEHGGEKCLEQGKIPPKRWSFPDIRCI